MAVLREVRPDNEAMGQMVPVRAAETPAIQTQSPGRAQPQTEQAGRPLVVHVNKAGRRLVRPWAEGLTSAARQLAQRATA